MKFNNGGIISILVIFVFFVLYVVFLVCILDKVEWGELNIFVILELI